VRIRDVTRALLLVAIAAAPLSAAAVTLSAHAGVLYSRSDTWPVVGESSTMPSLDLDLGLDARGVVISRDVLDYSLKTRWGRLSNGTRGGATSVRNMLSYGGRASLFDNTVSPVRLGAFVSRGEIDFSTSTAPDSFGQGISTSAGGTLALRSTGLSSLSAGYTWVTSESTIADQPTRDSTQHSVNSSLSFDNSLFRMEASYFGEFREGSWGTDNYSLHSGTMRASTLLGENVLSFDASSAFTLPEELIAGTFEQRTTSFSTLLNAGGAGNRRNFSYGYGHSIVESPDVPTAETSHQGFRYEGDHLATGETFFTRWLADASFGETRSDETVLRSTGETIGVSLWYKRVLPTSTLELNAGPRVSLLQTEDGDSGGYGASAGFRYSQPVGLHNMQASWNLNYGSNLFANVGWQFMQDLAASLAGPLATARYNLNLRANAFRTHSPVTGDGAGRSVDLVASLSTSQAAFDARASVSNGMLGATPQQFTSDGLLLPAPFDSTIIDASIGGHVKLYPGLSTSLRLRLGRADVPGRPVLHEAAASGGLTYRFAALSVALEDRLSRVETSTGWDTANLFTVTVSRSFGW
jgi:hypothetical protein